MAEEKKNKKKIPFVRFGGWVKHRFSKKKKVEAERVYCSNTPYAVLDDEGNYVYEEYATSLHEKIEAKKADYNIGIIAPYGAGKSSLIATYKKKYKLKDSETITISLANFNVESGQSDKEELPSVIEVQGQDKIKHKGKEKSCQVYNFEKTNPCMDLEGNIEKSILQQILYRESAKKLPNSRVARLDTFHGVRAFLISLFTILILAAGVFVGLAIADIFPAGVKNAIIIICSILLSILLLTLLYILLRNGILKKVKIRKVEFELDLGNTPSGGLSPLNRFLEEIIYFFQRTGCKIVFVEDLDRFDSLSIFSKLRELNTAINNAVVVSQPVKFVYAVKDTMFPDETTRAKFFDGGIVSLSPALTSANAYAKLMLRQEHLVKLGMEIEDKDFFLKTIAGYITEMRVLNNTINDYILMFKELKFTKDNGEATRKLFALMVYKNLYPKVYAELQVGKGEIAQVLLHKREFLSAQIKPTRDEYDVARAEYEKITSQIQWDFNLLKSIVQGIVLRYGHSSYGASNTLDALTPADGFSTLKRGAQISVANKSSGQNHYLTLPEINAHLKPHTVEGLEKEISDRSLGKALVKADEVGTLAKEIDAIARYSLKEAYERFVKGDVLKRVELFSAHIECYDAKRLINRLAIFLLSNGYIAEDYMNYITREQGVLSEQDRDTRASILARAKLDYAQVIENPEGMIYELPPEYFSSEDVLYFEIARAFCMSEIKSEEFTDKKNRFFAHLSSSNGDIGANDFILKFFAADAITETEKRIFIEILAKQHLKIADVVLRYADKELQAKIINMMCEICSLDILKAQNVENVITKYISSKPKYLDSVPSFDSKRFGDMLVGLGITLFDCSCDKASFERLKIVLQYERYVLSSNNTKFLLVEFLGVDKTQADTATYSSILSCDNDHIKDYVNKNLVVLLKEVVLKNKLVKEGQEAIDEILLSPSVTTEQKKEFIEKQDSSKLFNISIDYHNDFIIHALEKRKIAPTWDNFLCCWAKLHGAVASIITNKVLPVIKESIKALSKCKIDASTELAGFVAQQTFADGEFEQLIKGYTGSVTQTEKILDVGNYALLIKNGNIPFSVEALTDLVNRSPIGRKAIEAFAEKHEVEVKNNLSILSGKTGAIISYSPISWLKRQLYLDYGITEADFVVSAIDAILEEVKRGFVIPFEKVKKIMEHFSIDMSYKIEFFELCMGNEPKQNIELVLPHLPLYQAITTETKPFRKPKADYNEAVLTILKSKGVINYKSATKKEFEFS